MQGRRDDAFYERKEATKHHLKHKHDKSLPTSTQSRLISLFNDPKVEEIYGNVAERAASR